MSDAAVLFVHGIQGSPGQFQFLIDALPAGTEVRNLLLPGHGADTKTFRASGRADWLAAVGRETAALRGAGKRVLFVGHSMGCLLGLLTAAEEGPYAGMLLLCCPFRVRPTLRALRIGLKASRPETPDEPPEVTATRRADSVHRNHAAQQLTQARPYADLLRLMAETRRLDPKAPGDYRFFFSEEDEIISPRSRRHAADWPGAVVRILSGCGHNYFNPEAVQTLRGTLLSMLNEVKE